MPKRSNLVSLWVVYYIVPKKKIGHNQKGTTLEPLDVNEGCYTIPV